jgi:hypothetical protein
MLNGTKWLPIPSFTHTGSEIWKVRVENHLRPYVKKLSLDLLSGHYRLLDNFPVGTPIPIFLKIQQTVQSMILGRSQTGLNVTRFFLLLRNNRYNLQINVCCRLQARWWAENLRPDVAVR